MTLAPGLLASTALIDWEGSAFLLFYVITLTLFTVWCKWNTGRIMRRFDRPGWAGEPDDPHELAFLAGGAARVVQLAAARLVLQGKLKWKNTLWGARMLAAENDVHSEEMPAADRALHGAVAAAGPRGLLAREAWRQLVAPARILEVNLATRGLRPTAEERKSAIARALLPLMLLLLLGIVKVLVGIARDRPVWFLVGLLALTLVALVLLALAVPRLTESGVTFLESLRVRNEFERRSGEPVATRDLRFQSQSIALFGAGVLASHPEIGPLHSQLERLHAKAADAKGAGCGAGCGHSGGGDSGAASGGGGGGGGGCGGCGGGG